MANFRSYIIREQTVFDDDSNPTVSPYDIIWPVTVLDAVIDQNTAERTTLRQILDDILRRLNEGPEDLQIEYPVTSVRGYMYKDEPLRAEFLGDVIVTRESLDLENVDNTSDINKPISEPQMQWVKEKVADEILAIPPVDLSSLTAHLANFNNPHRVTFDQINNPPGGPTNVITNHMWTIINEYDTSGDNLQDIRELIKNLTNQVNTNNNQTTTNINNFINKFDLHESNSDSHKELFDLKEDKLNKVSEWTSPYIMGGGSATTQNLDHRKYPTTLAVTNYIERRIGMVGAPAPGDIPGLGQMLQDAIDAHNNATGPAVHAYIQNLIKTSMVLDTTYFMNTSNGWVPRDTQMPTGNLKGRKSGGMGPIEDLPLNTTIQNATIVAPVLTNAAIVNGETIQVVLGKLQAQINARELTISTGTTAQYRRGDKTWQDFNTAARGSTITAPVLTNSAIVNGDNFQVAFGKLQAQINDASGIIIQASAPAGNAKKLWINSTTTMRTINFWDGSSWIAIRGVTV